MAEVESSDAKWLAGIIDCEGHICIWSRSYNNHPASRYPTIGVTNSSLDLLNRIREIAQVGTILTISKTKIGTQLYRWSVTKFEDVKFILDMITPHLIVKKKEADILNDFITFKQANFNKHLNHRIRIENSFKDRLTEVRYVNYTQYRRIR